MLHSIHFHSSCSFYSSSTSSSPSWKCTGRSKTRKKVEKKKMRDRRGDLEHYVFGSSNALWDEWGRGRKKVKWWWWWERKRRKRLEFVCVCTPKINHPLISRSSSLTQTSIFFLSEWRFNVKKALGRLLRRTQHHISITTQRKLFSLSFYL